MKHFSWILLAALCCTLAFAQQQPVNIGTAPNSGNGDPLRTAFTKLNANDQALYQMFGVSALATPPSTTLMSFPLNTTNTFLGNLTFIGVNVAQNASIAAYENTFVGWMAGGSGHNTGDGLGGGTGITSNGLENTCVGWACLTQDTSGQFNTAVGVNALGHEVNGNQNVAIGTDAERNQVGSSSNVAVGVNACRNGSATNSNICIGVNTLQGVNTFPTTTTGNDNIAIGNNAMSSTSMTLANNNVMIGGSAGSTATTAFSNACAGAFCLTSITTGGGDTALGFQAGFSLVSSTDDTYIGQDAGQNAVGNFNTVVGSKAFVGSAGGGGSQNSIVGYKACLLCTSAAANIVIGYQVGSTTLTTGANNILLGISSATDTPGTATSNYLNINNAIKGSMAAQSAAGLSGCGSGASITGTDIGGSVTTGTGAGTCIINLAIANGTKPSGCFVLSQAGAVPAFSTSDNGTSATITFTAASSTTYQYGCLVH